MRGFARQMLFVDGDERTTERMIPLPTLFSRPSPSRDEPTVFLARGPSKTTIFRAAALGALAGVAVATMGVALAQALGV